MYNTFNQNRTKNQLCGMSKNHHFIIFAITLGSNLVSHLVSTFAGGPTISKNKTQTIKLACFSKHIKWFRIASETHSKHILVSIEVRHTVSPCAQKLEPRLEPIKNKPLKVLDFQGL